jgi:glycosyltransferase involved in cell wall biosynthesis
MTTRIAIVLPYGRLDTFPVICDLCETLAARDYDIDLYCKDGGGPAPPDFATERVRVLRIPGWFRRSPSPTVQPRPTGVSGVRRIALDRVDRMLRRPALRQMRVVYSRVRTTVAALDPLGTRRWRDVDAGGYGMVIGVDPQGIVTAASLATHTNATLAYHSLELLPRRDVRSIDERVLKARELRLSRRAAMVIVQDPSRASILIEDNGLDVSKVVYAPNAPRGAARRSPSRWWHRQLSISEGRRILLYAGSLDRWTGVDDLVSSAGSLPSDWDLVVHSNESQGSREHIERLSAIAPPRRVHFSSGIVRRQELRSLMDGADAGIAFYFPGTEWWTMQNLKTLGLASGKVSYYLWSGLPVIANSATSLGDLVERERIGVRVDAAEGVGAAVRSIADDYAQFSTRAVDFFNRELDFDRSAERIGRAVDLLTRGTEPQSAPTVLEG